jgi:hypothetical protein
VMPQTYRCHAMLTDPPVVLTQADGPPAVGGARLSGGQRHGRAAAQKRP